MTAGTAAQLMGTLDEKYIASRLAFESMVNHATLLFGSAEFRRPDGELDRQAIRELFERASWRFPPMRQRLMAPPLGLTTPAWVPVDHLDVERHVHFVDPATAGDSPDELLSGSRLGPLASSLPLWDVHVFDRRPEQTAMVVRVHHAMGDGILTTQLLSAITTPSPQPQLPTVTDEQRAALGTAPRNGLQLLLVTGGHWWRSQGSPAAAWREYWRKPFRNRLRRWGGRLLRARRSARESRPDGAASEATYLLGPLASLKQHAAALEGSPNDLIVATTLDALRRARPEANEVAVLVPYSRRRKRDARNHITTARIAAGAATPLAELVPQVARTMRKAFVGKLPDPGPAHDWLGYATYMTWERDTRYFGTAPVEELIGWPTNDPSDLIGCLSICYADRVSVAVRARDHVDAQALTDDLRGLFTAEVPDDPTTSTGRIPA